MSKQQANKNDLQKQVNLSDEIFDYMYNTLGQQLFLLAWYDDMTYRVDKITSPSKLFPQLYCNGSSY